MLISNIYVDENYHLFETPEIYSVTAPGALILLGYDDDQSFETPRINNHSVTSPSANILLGDDDDQSFEIPQNNHSVTVPSAHILLVSDSLQFQHNNRTHRPGQKLPPPGK